MHIDVHAHHYAPEYFECLSKLTGTSIEPTAEGTPVTLDERADMVKASGIDLQILSLGSAMQFLPKLADAPIAARVANDSLAAITHGYSGRFGAFGAVPLPNVDAALDEAARCLDELKMLGITLGCSIGDQSPEDPAFDPFWAEMNRRKAAVFFHPVARSVEPLLADYRLVFMVGACFEDTLAAVRIALSGLTTRYPDVRIIVPHLGGLLPLGYARVEQRVSTALLQQLYYDTAVGAGPGLHCACETLGIDRLVLGTDDAGNGKTQRGVDYIRQSGLDPEEIENILGGTAAHILQLQPSTVASG